MSEHRGTHPTPAPRALAELRLEDLPSLRDRVAGGWVVALVGSRPLDTLANLPLPTLAATAPELCGELIGAVRSDAALERLRGRGDGGAGAGLAELVGARTGAEVVDAVELLRGVLYEALLKEVPEPTPRGTADLCERVAHVCAAALAGALRGTPAEAGPDAVGGEHPEPRSGDGGGDGSMTARNVAGPGAGPQIVDELRDADPPAGERFPAPTPAPGGSRIAIRDRRSEHAPAEWLEAIARELERHEPRRQPFAVLLVELRDLERLRLQSTPAQLAADLDSFERALAGTGSVIRERPGRYWVMAAGADRRAARSLAEGLAASLAAGPGEQLQTLTGIAVYPADGRHAAALAAHADVDLIAARAARR